MTRYENSFGISYSVAALLVAILFATKIAVPQFGEWAEGTFGHAWLYMGIFALAVFLGLGMLRVGANLSEKALTTIIVAATVGSGGIIAVASLISTILFGPMG
jgi:hypothetical protein